MQETITTPLVHAYFGIKDPAYIHRWLIYKEPTSTHAQGTDPRVALGAYSKGSSLEYIYLQTVSVNRLFIPFHHCLYLGFIGRWYAPSPRHLRSLLSEGGGSSCGRLGCCLCRVFVCVTCFSSLFRCKRPSRRRSSMRGLDMRIRRTICLCVFCVGPLCGPPLRWWVLCVALPSVLVPCGWGPPLSCSCLPWHLFLELSLARVHALTVYSYDVSFAFRAGARDYYNAAGARIVRRVKC